MLARLSINFYADRMQKLNDNETLLCALPPEAPRNLEQRLMVLTILQVAAVAQDQAVCTSLAQPLIGPLVKKAAGVLDWDAKRHLTLLAWFQFNLFEVFQLFHWPWNRRVFGGYVYL